MAGIPVVFPADLPGPALSSVSLSERRVLSDLTGGPEQARGIQRDYLGTQDAEWDLLTPSEALEFDTWWTSLTYGGQWFASTWPAPQGWVSLTRRFMGVPAWEHLPGGFWKVTAKFQVRGRGLPPQNYNDPYFPFVLLHLNGDDVTNAGRDFSPLHFATGINGTPGPTISTSQKKYGPGSINLLGGEVVVAADNVYSTPMGADEFTLQWWTYINALPLNGNDRIAFFGPFQLAISALGDGNGLNTEINDVGGGGRTAYAPSTAAGAYVTGQWIHTALVRTNGVGVGGSFAQIDLFVAGQIQTPSSTFPKANPVGTTGFSWVGGGGGTNCLVDDFQLTRRVNRYRGLTSFTPPGQLPTS